MTSSQLNGLYNDKSKDLIWMVDHEFRLIYANKTYLNFMEEVVGTKKTLNDSALLEHLGEDDMKKWKGYYKKALDGTYFEIEEHYFNPKLNDIQFRQTIFEPIINEDNDLVTVACRSKDITRLIKHKSEASQLIDASLDVFCTINTKGEFVYVSASSLKHWGYRPEELLGKPFMDFVLEEDIAKTNDITAAVHKGEKTKSFFNRYQKKDGSIAYNLWSATWDDNRKLMYAVARDGKETIEHDEKLLQSEQRFKALVQGGNDLYAIIDLEGRYTYMSPSSTAIIGIPPEAFIGMDAFEFIHPDDIEQTRSSLKEIATEDKVVMELYRARNQHGEWRWVETLLTNMLDHPAVNGIVINSRDITKEVEEKHQLKLLESVITNTQEAVLITEAEPFDEPGPKIIYVNDAFVKMTGYTAEEVIGKTPRILQGPNSNKEDLEKLGRALRNWESHEITTINYKKNGEEFWINFEVSPIANETGRYTHWIAIERDVTEKKNRELEKDLISNINSIFNQDIDNDLSICLTDLLRELTAFGDFEFSEIWLTAIDEKRINRVANYAENEAGHAFHKATKSINSLELGEGLPGYVWKTKTIEIWEEFDGNWISKRKNAAINVGLQCMMGIPLIHKEAVLGVLLIATPKTKSFINKYKSIFKRIELTISAELNRKKVEIELAQIFDFTPDMICVAGFDGFIKRINPAGLEMLGYSLDEIRSKPIVSFMHQDDRVITNKKQKKLYKGKKLQSFENRYITKTGHTIWLSWTATSAPEYGIVYAAAKNITEEKKLRELNRQVGKLAKIGSWEVDVVNHTVFWSDEVHQIYGTDPRSFVPNIDAAINFYREDYRELAGSSFEKCILNQEPYTIEAVIVNSNNKELWVRTTAKAEFINGVCTRVYGSFQDISAIKETENRLLSLSENLPGVVYQYLINPNGTDELRYVSKGAERTSGFTANEWTNNINLLFNQIEAGGNMEEFKSSIRKSIETKSKWTCRYKYVLPTGEVRTHMGFGMPNFLADGTVLFNNIALDITQEAKNEELLELATKVSRIGSWELNLINQEGDEMYWSPMLFEILELDHNFKPTLKAGIEFHTDDSQDIIKKALHRLIEEGIEFDEEILVITAKGNKRWNRAIGKCEIVNHKVTRIYGSYQDIHEQKVAALALEKSLKALKDYTFALDQSAIIATTDHKGVITSVNDNFCKISQYNEKELIGKTHRLINSNHHPKGYFKNLWETISSGKVWRGELKNKAKDGSYYWVDTTIVPFLDESNQPFQYLAIRFDITERKRVEESLITTSEQLRLATTSAKLGIWDWDVVNDNLTWDDRMYTLYGVKEEDFEGTISAWTNGIHSDDVERATKDLYDAVTGVRDFKSVFRVVWPDESVHYIEGTAIVSRDIKGNAIRMIGSNIDITDLKIAEQEILEAKEKIEVSEAKFKSYTEQSPIAIYTTDIKGDCIYANETWLKMAGMQLKDALGKGWVKALHPEDLEYVQKNWYKSVKSNGKWSYEYRFTDEKQNITWVNGTAKELFNENDELIGYLGYNVDITERKKAEQEKNNLQVTIENSLNEIYIFDAKTFLFTYVNKGAYLNLGYSEEEIKTLTPIDIKPDYTPNTFNHLVAPLIRKEKEKILFFTNHLRKDGSMYPVEVHLQLFTEGENKRFLAIILDITERKKAEEKILLANERFVKVTEATNDAIWDWDIVNDTFYRSEAIEHFFGRNTLKSFSKLDFWKDRFHPEDKETIINSVDAALADPKCERWEQEYRIVRPEGRHYLRYRPRHHCKRHQR